MSLTCEPGDLRSQAPEDVHGAASPVLVDGISEQAAEQAEFQHQRAGPGGTRLPDTVLRHTLSAGAGQSGPSARNSAGITHRDVGNQDPFRTCGRNGHQNLYCIAGVECPVGVLAKEDNRKNLSVIARRY